MNKWDRQYQEGTGLRWWPEGELVRFLGRAYGATWKVLTRTRGKALDLGCGTGRNMWALKEAGFEPFGVEVSAEAMECAGAYLEQRQVQPAMVIVAPLPQILYAESLFELVVDCQTIQHLTPEEHVHAYLEVERVLKPGGRFWSMHVADGDFAEVYQGQYPELLPWRAEDLAPLLAKAGLMPQTVTMVARSERSGAMAWHVLECQRSK